MCAIKEIKVTTLVSTLMTVLVIITCASDWYFYYNISIIEEGLVYGPLVTKKTVCFLVWTIIGTIFALVKIAYNVLTIAEKINVTTKEGFTAILDLASDAIYLLPKVGFKLWIIKCREEGLNVLLFVTTIFDILSCAKPLCWYSLLFFKWLAKKYGCCECCSLNDNNEGDTHKTHEEGIELNRACKEEIQFNETGTEDTRPNKSVEYCDNRLLAVISVAHFLISATIAVITIAVIVYSVHFRGPKDGAILSRSSGKYRFNIYSKIYNMDRYFKNVGVYFAHPKLDKDLHYNFSDVDLIELYPFYHDIFDKNIVLASPDCFPNKNLTHKIGFSDVPGEPVSYLKITYPGTDRMECYKIDKATKQIEKTEEFLEIQKHHSYTIIIKSEYISPRKSSSRVFGRIRFNWRTLWSNGSCIRPDIAILDGDFKSRGKETAIIHYFRKNKGIHSESYYLMKHQSELRFYNAETDLEDIKKVWRPGGAECSSTGDLAPIFDEGLDMDCA